MAPRGCDGRLAVHFRPFPLDLLHGCALYQETSDNTSRLQICDDGAESNFVILLTPHSECMIIILPVSDAVVFGFLYSPTGCSMVGLPLILEILFKLMAEECIMKHVNSQTTQQQPKR